MKCAAINCDNEIAKDKNKYCSIHGHNGKCQIPGCDRRATKNYSLCSMHDLNWKKLFPNLKQKPTTYDRFLKFIRIDNETTCWIWTGCISNGYPFFYDGDSPVHAFRYAYEITYGLTNKTVYHKCKNVKCCNPEHLTINNPMRIKKMADKKFFNEIALPLVLKYEGGYTNHPADKGGPTNKGIIQTVYDKYRLEKNLDQQTVKNILDNEIEDIYFQKYWLSAKCDQFSPKIAVIHFDSSVNCGVYQAAKFLQRSVKVKDDGIVGEKTIIAINQADKNLVCSEYISQRRSFYELIVKRNPSQQVFLKGWMNRIISLQSVIKNI